jgi:hypothetical protein
MPADDTERTVPAHLPGPVAEACYAAYRDANCHLIDAGRLGQPVIGYEELPYNNPAIRAALVAAYTAGLTAQHGLTDQWAALYNDGTWTSGQDQSRDEAEEILATARRLRTFSWPVLAHRLVGPWQTEEVA